MKIKDVMTKVVEMVRPEATFQEAAGKMKDLDVGPMPVAEGGRWSGIAHRSRHRGPRGGRGTRLRAPPACARR